jgi:lysylphosphatidylglycerol synthetase-like protein (DUF2156 family)
VLLGLPFPRHMRAVDDDLDRIWTLVGTDQGNATARRADLERVRDANRDQLGRWLGRDQGTWQQLYQRERARQRTLALITVALLVLALGLTLWRRRLGWGQAAASTLWMVALVVACGGVFALARGSFDFTSINLRSEFVRASLCICVGVGAGAGIVHLASWRDPGRLLADLSTVLVAVAALDAAHPLIYGWPMGYPLPHPMVLFWPFFAAPLALGLGAIAGLTAVVLAMRGR